MTPATHGATHGVITERSRTDSRPEGKGREGNWNQTSVCMHRHLGDAPIVAPSLTTSASMHAGEIR
jgi:hypothetical protein